MLNEAGHYVEKLISEAEGVFILGDTSGAKTLEDILRHPNPKIAAVRAFFTFLNTGLPDDIKDKFHGLMYKNTPLGQNYCDTVLLGKGAVNRAYCIYSSENEIPTHVVLFNTQKFKTVGEAEYEARRLQEESSIYANIFKSIPDFIPKQIHLIFKDYLGRPSIMCIREFIGGPLRDAFTEISSDELVALAKKQPTLKNKLLAFATLCLENRDFLTKTHFDLLGSKNLSLAGTPPNCNLVLVESQSAYIPPNAPRLKERAEDYEKRVSERIDYVVKVARELET